MSLRLRRAAVWLLPFALLATLRVALGVPDELFAMPANGIPLMPLEGLINFATGFSLWFGVLAFLARLVWDDSPGLAAILIGIIAMQIPFAACLLLF
jgi:hypothetical protein